jgi:small subunit ribosomal protein S17e
MGRIKTKMIKRYSRQIYKEYESELTKDFEQNKKKITDVADIPSKKVRNVIAGYLARLVKNKQEI